MSINPFSYGKPIDDPARFIGHSRAIEQVYSRLLSAFESSSIVGERRIGKTSLLKILGHPDMQARYGLDPEKYIFVFQDFQFIETGTMPTRFWQRVLRSIRRAVKSHEDVCDEIDAALEAETIDNYTLDDIFSLIDDEELYIVLLLDEFANVTRNENFDDDFFAGLRALAIHHNLALITSSREELVELTHSEKVRSSPFFNIFASINLRPFSETDATELIDTYLADTGVKFLLSEINLIFSMAGYHPYFLQMVGHHLFAAHQQGLDDAARRQYVMEKARSEAEPLFQDYWKSSSDSQKIVLTIMALREIERKVGKNSLAEFGATSSLRGAGHSGQEDSIDDLERFYVRAGQALDDLERRGLIVKNPETSGYYLFSSELSDMVAKEITGDVDDLRGWRDWQKDESLTGALPVELQDKMAQTVHHLNPAYRNVLGKWVLEPATVELALQLLENFVGHYDHELVTDAPPDSAEALPAVPAAEPTPEAETEGAPQGLFARVSQRLETKEPDTAVGPSLDSAIESLDRQQREEMIYSLKRQLVLYTKNISKLQEDAATYGSLSSAPLKLQNEIEEIENIITELETKLNALEQE